MMMAPRRPAPSAPTSAWPGGALARSRRFDAVLFLLAGEFGAVLSDAAVARVLVVDEQEVVRRGVTGLLHGQAGITVVGEAASVAAAVRAGASGFLLKQVRGPALVSAVRTVASGGTFFDEVAPAPERIREPAAAGSDRLGLLTDQERTVLRLIGEGLTNRQIGQRMGLAEKTVKNYTSHLLAKLGLERRTQAAILATELRDRPAG